MTATPRHQFLNLLQSILLLAGMAVIAWFIVSAVAGPGLAISIVIGSLLGLLLSPGIPKRLLLNAYGARRLSGREFPEGMAILAELARRAGLPRNHSTGFEEKRPAGARRPRAIRFLG